MREKIFNIIEPRSAASKGANIYDLFMVVVIVFSFVPLVYRETTMTLRIIEGVAGGIFIVDYILRWITADLKLGGKGIKPFLRYPFTPMAIVDLLSILPIVVAIHPAFKAFRAMRLVQALRFLRIVRLFRYSKNMAIIGNVLKKNAGTLLMILLLAVGYILLSSIVIFQVETETFKNYFDAVYWSTVSLTTIGYGDYYPVTDIGKFITIISSIIGVAVVALPAGVITAGYMNEIKKNENKSDLDEKIRNAVERAQKDLEAAGLEEKDKDIKAEG